MQNNKQKITRGQVLEYLIDEFYSGDLQKVRESTGYSISQLQGWISGTRIPQKQTVEYLIHRIYTPEFRVIKEFGEFSCDHSGSRKNEIMKQIKNIIQGHENSSGIYAFYDSMANLIYIGKASSLLAEIYAAINRTVEIALPKGIINKPQKRWEIVRYISAYDVGYSDWLDYPKHVESLILRISKPILNKNIGKLQHAYVPPEDI
jgi:hypothetical protein